MNRPLARWYTASLVVVGLLGWVATAAAQATITVQYTGRKSSVPSSRGNGTWIGRQECLEGDEFYLTATVSGSNPSSYTYEAWVGSDCGKYESRNGSTRKCLLIDTRSAAASFNITLPVQAMVTDPSTYQGTGLVPGDVTACTPASGTSPAKDLTVYFLLLTNLTDEVASPFTFKTKYDLIGPQPPTGATASGGETMLKLSWTPSDPLEEETTYRFYCYPVRGAEYADAGKDGSGEARATPMAGDAGDVDVIAADAGEAGGGAGASGAGGDGGASGAGGEAGTGGAGGSALVALPEGCPAGTPFREGDMPDETYRCGSAPGGSSGKVTGLKDGVVYAVGVAAVDSFDNPGKLSNIACATPVPVDDFFDLYKEAGGKGGGGFCTLSDAPGAAGHAGFSATFAALAATALMRRRIRR
jgi:uncharacterized membrane protein YgcG